ncbi:MAG: helix-turn-helix transcriptional regulator [Planctomycetes bacterium]|nr:helix-turn-helix transcriptional regulator [Planctomycetota bacterium]
MVALPICQSTLRAPRPAAGYPVELRTVGEHVRRRRLDLGLSQRAMAGELRVHPATILNWERGKTEPGARMLARIIKVLGYHPRLVGSDLPSRIRAAREIRGLTQEQLAEDLGLDPSTVRKWERGRKRPYPRLTRIFEAFVGRPSI